MTGALHDPGGQVRLQLAAGVTGEAVFSADGRYRQILIRDWTAPGAAPRAVFWLGMNPSTADASVDDPTCYREVRFSRSWEFTRYLKGNMLDWRATSPKDIPADPAAARSPDNLPAILQMADEAEIVVLAYGRLHSRFAGVVDETLAALAATGQPLRCLGRNADGSAKHPLYLASACPLLPWDA